MTCREVFTVQARQLIKSSNGFPLRAWVTVRGLENFPTQEAAEDAAGDWLVDQEMADEIVLQTRVISGTARGAA